MKASIILWLCCIAFLTGCGKQPPSAQAPHPRLVTFSPALTTMVFDMGLGDHVVGVTSFASLPEGEQRSVVGNALSVRAEPILAVKPDVVLSQIESKHFEPLRKMNADIRIEHFRIETLKDIGEAMARIGQIADQPNVGMQAKATFEQKLDRTRQEVRSLPRRRVMFVVGYQNPLAPGKGTFIDEMITLAGGINVFGQRHQGWRKATIETILELEPEIIICQSNTAQQSDAARYWSELGGPAKHASRRVIVVTDPAWTIPTGQLADFTAQLAVMIHPELNKESSAGG